jgi:muramidase (phage lysozyme)
MYAFDPTYEEISILGQIYRQQSGGRYNILYGGAYFTGPKASPDQGWSKFPTWAGLDNSHAAGAPQYEPKTWAAVQAATGVPDFSPTSQDIGALWLLRTQGQTPWATNFTYDGGIYAFAAGTPE